MITSTCQGCKRSVKTDEPQEVTCVGKPPTPPNFCSKCGGKFIHYKPEYDTHYYSETGLFKVRNTSGDLG